MKVKIGSKIYDSEETPIMVILSDTDKENILNMHTDKQKYACFPEDSFNMEEAYEWMEEGKN